MSLGLVDDLLEVAVGDGGVVGGVGAFDAVVELVLHLLHHLLPFPPHAFHHLASVGLEQPEGLLAVSVLALGGEAGTKLAWASILA